MEIASTVYADGEGRVSHLTPDWAIGLPDRLVRPARPPSLDRLERVNQTDPLPAWEGSAFGS